MLNTTSQWQYRHMMLIKPPASSTEYDNIQITQTVYD